MLINATHEEIEDIRLKFEDLEYFTHAVVRGMIRGLIVEGDPGIGKTYGISKIFDDYRALNESTIERFEIIGGNISTLYIYKKLYEFRHRGMTIVFDDCEIKDVDGINTLKHALDSGDKRMISWYKSSSQLKKDNIPEKFEYKGGVIFLTNSSLTGHGGKRDEHMSAIVSRCHYLNMRLTERQRLIRIQQVVTPMLAKYRLGESQQDEILQFVADNLDSLRELSLRTVTKIADLYCAFPDRWLRMAKSSCCVEVQS